MSYLRSIGCVRVHFHGLSQRYSPQNHRAYIWVEECSTLSVERGVCRDGLRVVSTFTGFVGTIAETRCAIALNTLFQRDRL